MNDPMNIIENEWSELTRGTKSAQHPFHTFSFCSVNEEIPNSRTVVIRKVSKKTNEISFNTDNRSTKFKEISINNNVCCLFYDKKRKVQLRISGKTYINQDNDKSIKSWKSMTNESKICYMGPYAPSTMLNSFEPNLPPLLPHQITQEYDDLGYENFCIVDISIYRVDWLYLDHKGHKRLLFYLGKNIEPHWISS
jgi:pyridoxamine 5'-phosphate oxidase